MPALYGFTGNANVAVGNTIGLYQQNTGVTQVLTSAQTLLSLLSNASSVGFSLTSANTQVQASVQPSGVTSGTYGAAGAIPIITVGGDGRVTSVSTIAPLPGNYGNANVTALLSGAVTIGNLTVVSGVYWANGQPYSPSSIYSNANVAAFLTTYTGNLSANNVTISNKLFANDIVSANLIVEGDQIIYGNLTVQGNTTTINSNVITTNDLNITVGNNQTSGVALNNAGLDVGSNNLATWRYNNPSTSWQSNISITPQSNNALNLGSPTLQWSTVYGHYFSGDGSQLVNLPVQPGTYSNSNVASYLPTYTGNVGGTIANIQIYQISSTNAFAPVVLVDNSTATSQKPFVNASLPGSPVTAINLGTTTAIESLYWIPNTSTVLAHNTVAGGIVKSTDNGQTWSATTGSSSGATYTGFASNGGAYFATTSTNNGIYKSIDGGTTWSQTNATTGSYYAVIGVGSTIFAGRSNGLYSSTDGINFSNTSLINFQVTGFYNTGSVLFAGTNANGIWRSTNNGTSWTNPLTSGNFTSFTQTGTLLLAAGYGNNSGVYKSSDNGVTWTQTSQTSGYFENLLYVGNGVVLATQNTTGQGLWRSLDSGQTWSQVPNTSTIDAYPYTDLIEVNNKQALFGVRFDGTNYFAYKANMNLVGMFYNAATNTLTANINTNGNVAAASLITTNGLYWSNGASYSSTLSTYGNSNVAAYLPSDPTIQAIQSGQTAANTNITNNTNSINTLSANLGGFETWANLNFQLTSTAYSNSNVASYLPTSTINFGGNINGVQGNTTITSPTEIVDMSTNTGALVLPFGANSSRPTVAPGGIRYNTDLDTVEYWNGSEWLTFSANTSPPPPSGLSVRYLIAAGGGGGGSVAGGGGGAGGLITGNTSLTTNTSYTITVGAGGAGHYTVYYTPVQGGNGSSSGITELSLSTFGGGGGGSYSSIAGSSGGSGGGGGQAAGSGGAGTIGQGNDGGSAAGTTGAGGGGAGAVGTFPNGGNGLSNNITGTGVYYSGGGGGGGDGTGGSGGSGGGGTGGTGNGGTGTDATANTGGGGGGAGGSTAQSGNGGSGVIVLAYQSATQQAIGGNVTTYSSGGNNYFVHTFGSSGTFDTTPPIPARYLVVAGGGAGGYGGPGGGGAGGLITGNTAFVSGETITVTVGAGGAFPGSPNTNGNPGNNSVLTIPSGATYTAIGGGYGATGGVGGNGGSGGGSSQLYTGAGDGGDGTAGQGNNGGIANGGGGGAGAAGDNGYGYGVAYGGTWSGNGGAGLQVDITGSATYYAGGGAGYAYPLGGASGGSGGGGNNVYPSSPNTSGTANTGGGGAADPSGAGGSGVVIISVPTAQYTGTTTGSPTVTTSGANTILKFTSSGSYTA